jgi:Putative metal-binding motif
MQAPVKFVLQFRKTLSPLFAPIANAQHGLRFELTRIADQDGDGSPNCVDCNDADPRVNPQASELPGDAIDQNCDGEFACSPNASYRNHEAYVSCVSADADALLKAGRITEAEKAALIKQAVESDVGK